MEKLTALAAALHEQMQTFTINGNAFKNLVAFS